jgi:hypothetical protein
MIENLCTALVAVVLIGGMVAFLPGSAHAWPWYSVGGYDLNLSRLRETVPVAHVHRGNVITCGLD